MGPQPAPLSHARLDRHASLPVGMLYCALRGNPLKLMQTPVAIVVGSHAGRE